MNRIHRVIWSEHTGTWIAVAETARGRGKGSGRAARKAMLAALLAMGLDAASAAPPAATTVVPANAKTVSYVSANGVPVVDIATANASGLSHNVFNRYDVNANGLVLNNGNASQILRQSQLAGQVPANMNLNQEAKVILNEVVGANRSTLAGFTEVLGGKADVIVANPYGITCNGCGFINTDRVTLTTGVANIAADGSLTGFTVRDGQVAIGGAGANAGSQQIFDIVARSVLVNGKLNTTANGSLGITLGNNIWDYASRNVTGSATGAAAAPSYAFDSTLLGGMYAGRIRIVATEAGVGVRMLGEAAASADDFTMNSAGKIEIQSAVSAARDASLISTATSGAQDIFVNGANAKLSAAHDVAITATAGQVKLAEGELYAGNNLAVSAGSLDDVSAAARTRFAGAGNSIATSGAASIGGAVWGAGKALTGKFGSLAVGAGSTKLYAGTTLELAAAKDLALGAAAVRSVGDMTLAAGTGAISSAAGSGQGIQATAGNISLMAGNGVSNAGAITADSGSVTARVDGTLANSGTVHASTVLDLAGKAGGATGTIGNAGLLITEGSLAVKAAELANQSGATVQASKGASVTGGKLTNAGVLIASDTAGQSGTFTVASLTNSGTLQSKQDLALNVSGSLVNSGTLLAAGDIVAGAAALRVTNAGTGVMQAGRALSITGSDLENRGSMQSTAAMTLALGNALDNSGTLLTQAALASASGSLNNSGTLQAAQGAGISAKGAAVNSGKLIASTSSANGGSIKAATLSNTASGVIQSAQSLAIDLTGNAMDNAGVILAADMLTLTATGAPLALNNSVGAYLQAGKQLTVGGNAVALDNGGNLLADQFNLRLARLANAGVIQGGAGASGIAVSGALDNSGVLTLASKHLGGGGISAASLSNSGQLQSAGDLQLTVSGRLGNAGVLLADGHLSSTSASMDNSGTLQANDGSAIAVTGELLNSGDLIASGSASSDASLRAATLSNGVGATIQSGNSLAIAITGNKVDNYGTIMAAKALTLRSGGTSLAVTNFSRAYLQAGDALSLTGNGVVLNNKASANVLANQVQVSASSIVNAGLIQGGAAASTLSTSGDVSNSGVITLAGSAAGSGALNASALLNTGTLQSAADLTLAVIHAIDNSGTVLAAGKLSSNSSALNNAGTMQANKTSTIVATGALANSGKLLAGDASSLSGTTLRNDSGGVIQSGQDLAVNLSGATLNNDGTIVAGRDLTLAANGSALTVNNLSSAAYLQADQALTLGGNAVVLSNKGNVVADRLALTVVSLTNDGNVQGGNGASTIVASGAVSNTGTMTLAKSAGSGAITAASVTNSGTLQSYGSARFDVATALTNSGKLLTTGAMTVRGTAGSYSVTNSNRMESGGLMDIKGKNNSNAVNLTNNGVLLGGSMDVNAANLTVGSNAMVSSLGNMGLALGTLTFMDTTSRVVAATSGSGAATINVANDFFNTGAVHSGGDLSFTAASIDNGAGAGFSALKKLTLNAPGSSIDNHGALYAGSQLDLNTGGLSNVGGGTIDSGGGIKIAAASFLNNNSVVAGGAIDIAVKVFRNEVTGGDTRVWGAYTAKTTTEVGHDSQGYNGHGCCDQYETWYYTDTWSRDQHYTGSSNPVKPTIIGGLSLTIRDFDSGTNLGGTLYGQALTLKGNAANPAATFVNDDLALKRESTTDSYVREIKYIAAGPETYHDYYHHNSSVTTVPSQISAIGASIQGEVVDFGGFALTQSGSTQTAAPRVLQAPGATATTLAGAVAPAGTTAAAKPAGGASATGGATSVQLSAAAPGATSAQGVSGVVNANGKPAVSFGGLLINLPTNPNGYFVVSQSADAKYLIESNPLFAVGSNSLGSDYLAQRYGYNPDVVIKQLGDANYEAYLIRQQLISQTGTNLLKGYGSEANQVKRLMDQAINQGKHDGLVYGKALTAAQVAGLQEDIVWMVETTVAGQKVLAPVVYLAAATRLAIETGAVIGGDDVTMNVTAFTNTGGTLSGANSLAITSKGDITNTSGTIKGGNVAITSTAGSIRNQTQVQGSGDDKRFVTTIGKTAGISATGTLDLAAKKDITVIGGDVTAGGNASLAAGGNVTFDTIVDKNTSTTHSSSGSGLASSRSTTTTTTEKNIGSNLTSGGDLKIVSGGDTTIAGSKVSTGGDLAIDAGGDINILARQDKVTTRSETSTSGAGVGGGVVGSQKTTVDSFTGTNVGSSVTVGGSLTADSKKSLTLQGSDVTVAGNADIAAKDGIKILDGLNEERVTTRTETTTFMKMDNAGEKDASAGKQSTSTGKRTAGNLNGSASAGAQAEAGASGTSDLKLSETTTTNTQAGSKTSVASNLTVGGDVKLKTDGTLTLQGSNVAAGGDLAVDAKKVSVLTGRNETWSNTQTTQTSTGIYNEGEAKASADASAQAKGGYAATDASATANASATAGGTTTIGARTSTEETTAYTLTNSSSSLKSGGNMSIKAKDDATFVGANVEAGGNLKIDATSISNLAAQDLERNTSSKTTHTAGVYIDAKVGAEAKADADAGKVNLGGSPANASASAQASADASAGVRYKNESSSSSDGSVTQVVSTFKAGGDVTRTAKDTITDQGTQIEAGGNINQTARKITEIEANNSTYSSSNSSTHDAKVGVGAGASASAKADAASGEAGAEAGAGAGLRASYSGKIEGKNESSTTAVTTSYKAGGNINSTSSDKTTLIGTKMQSGGDINLTAGSLDFKAARDTASSSSTSNEINAALKVDVVGKAGVSGSADYANAGESEKSSTARAGSLGAAGNVIVKTAGNASFEGTQIDAGGKVAVTGDKVEFKAARDTTESRSTAISASVEASSSKKDGVGAKAGASYAQSDSASSTAQVASIKSGEGISIIARKDADFEGTKLKSGGDTSIAAGGTVNLKAATDTATTTSFGVEASVGGAKSSKGSSKEGSLGGSVAYANKVDSTVTSIDAGGKVAIKGNTVVSQEAAIAGAGGKKIDGRQVDVKAEKKDVSVGLALTVSGSKETEAPKKGSKTTDDLADKKAPPAADAKPRSKTTDDLPAKSTSKPGTPAEQAAERKATIDQLKADKITLDKAVAKKAPAPAADPAAERKATIDQLKADRAKLDAPAPKKAPPAAAKPAEANKPSEADKAAERKATVDQLKADRAKLDAAAPKKVDPKAAKEAAAQKQAAADKLKAAERKAAIDQLKADKAALDKALPGKKG